MPVAARPAIWADADFAASVLSAINARRRAAGLPAVAADSRLTSSATSYALLLERTGSLSHTADGTTMDVRAAAAGFNENVAMGEILAMTTQPSAAAIVQMWMDSPGHRDQMLSPTFRLAGAGCAFNGTDLRCVVDFAG